MKTSSEENAYLGGIEGGDDSVMLVLDALFQEAISGAENSYCGKETFPDCLILLLGRTPIAIDMVKFMLGDGYPCFALSCSTGL